MVLVSEAELSDGKFDEALFIREKSVPACQDVEGGHHPSQMGFEIVPAAMKQPLEIADGRQHRKHRFDEHPEIVLSSPTDFQVRGITALGVKMGIPKDDHLPIKLLDKGMEHAVMHISRRTIPSRDLSPLVEGQTELSSHNPAVIGDTFLATLIRTPSFPNRMNQLDPITIDHSKNRGIRQEACCPSFVGLKQPKQPSAFRKLGNR